MVSRKRCVSVRLRERDLERLSKLSERLDIQTSDLIRFAVQRLLGMFMPLINEGGSARARLATLLDQEGLALIRQFDIDSPTLMTLINECNANVAVTRDDVDMLVLSAIAPNHLQERFLEIAGIDCEPGEIFLAFREYLRMKYSPAEGQTGQGTDDMAPQSPPTAPGAT